MKQLILCDDAHVHAVAPLCRRLGAGIEVQAFYDPRVLEQNPAALEEHRLAIEGIAPVALHGCFGDLCPGSWDALVRQVARQRFEQSYAAASALGAQHLILHHGYVPHTSSPEGWIRRSAQFWQDFLAEKDTGMRVHLENLLEWDAGLIREVVQSVDRPNLDINLDIGHAHCNSRISVVAWIEQLGGLIGYVHLHDNRGSEDEHLGLGQGTIPLRDVCQALLAYAPNAVWALEAEGEGLWQSVEWLGENGFLSG